MAARRETKLVVGLIGQVCAGKTTVAEAFRQRGAVVYDADREVHELYARAEVVAQVRALCGEGVLDRHGAVDRQALARLVFADPAQLKALTEQVVFPRVREAAAAAIRRFRGAEAGVLVLDAPTLVEAGQAEVCNQLVFVAAPLARRQQWAAARGWEAGELARREGRLGDEKQKRRAASAVIANDGTPQDLQRRVDELLAAWSGGS